MAFTHLHVHTGYSLLDGAAKIKDLVKRAVELGMTSLAITDHGVMYGCIEFYEECKKNGIKPIIGCEVYVAPGSRFDREQERGDDRYYHLILLAKNEQGYHNLAKIVSAGFIDGFYYKPRVDREILEKYHEGIICTSACLAGELPKNLLRGRYEAAKEVALYYQNLFGEGNYYLEIQDHGIPEQRDVISGIMRLHNDTGIPIIATNDSHYVYSEDAEAHDILLCIQTGKTVNDPDRMRYDGGQYYLKSEEEMRRLFPYCQEAIDNTALIADACNVEIKFGEYKAPVFDVPAEYVDAYDYLKSLCEEGLVRRYGDLVTDVHRQRLAYELDTIKSMGFVEYFLIVYDYVHFAKTHGISVGPGRGSAAGSIVSYCLEITNLDPIKFDLLFERFLNPERVSMPDIDIDFLDERRHEVIDYVIEKYGRPNVCQIITYGTLAPKMCIRDVGRVLDLPYQLCDTVAKAVPNGVDIKTIEIALEQSKDLRELYASGPDVKHLIDIVKKLQGLPRHVGKHAAGVVIAPDSVDEFVPLSKGSDGVVTTQYEKTTVEHLGLLKMDFLGLKTLSVLKDSLRFIKQTHGIDIDLDKIPLDDKKVYKMLSDGRTEGVFQLESGGMKGFMKELKPSRFEEIIAGISLYRPGPMDFIPAYLEGKHSPETVTYDHPYLEEILKPTYGCIVYQEQVMQIVMKLGGFSMGRSDTVRAAMSKKKFDIMENERQNFVYGNALLGIPGCVGNGISEEIGNKVYDSMIDFAKYAFNKSHAAVYAIVAYQTAYLKTYYPAEYFAALMTSVKNDPAKVSGYIKNCKDMGIEILPPAINSGEGDFSVDGGNIRYGLSALRSVGEGVTEIVHDEIVANGPFTDLEDFVKRLSGKEANKRTIESFILGGAFDSFGKNRRQMMMVYQQILDSVSKDKKNLATGQMSLFDSAFMPEEEVEKAKVKYPDVPEFEKSELLSKEREVLGIYVSGHPLEDDMDIIDEFATAFASDFMAEIKDDDNPENEGLIDDEFKVKDKESYTIVGVIDDITMKITKRGDNMAFLKVLDTTGVVEVVVFPRDYNKFRDMFIKESKVIIKGNAQVGEDAKLIISSIETVESARRELEAKKKRLWLRVESLEEYKQKEVRIKEILLAHKGGSVVKMVFKDTNEQKTFEPIYKTYIDDELIGAFINLLGEENVIVTTK